MASTDYSRGLIAYTDRDYVTLYENFKKLVPTLTDLWTPEADADPGVVIGKYIASVADMLGVNIDWLANEIYAPTVAQRKDAEKIFGLIGYSLGFYTAGRTEITFKNTSAFPAKLDFGFNGANFSTVTANTDITGASRVINYNIIPLTNVMGADDTRSTRNILTSTVDIFSSTDPVVLQPNETITRVGIEGTLRSVSYSAEDIANTYKYTITLPSQHIDTTAVWVRSRSGASGDEYLSTQWTQVASAAEFVTPEPRFVITYDNYSNAQIQFSNYLNQLENFAGMYLTVYWIDCSGVIGSVNENVLGDLQLAIPTVADGDESLADITEISISNLSNISEFPHTYTVTGKSPETAKEAYINSRNYINTWDSLITLPDYNRFLLREPGTDCGIVIDCQKALEINQAIYHDGTLTDTQKAKKYITNQDFERGSTKFKWQNILEDGYDTSDPSKTVMKFTADFKTYVAMCYAVYNDFKDSSIGSGSETEVKWQDRTLYKRYLPPKAYIDGVVADYRPLQSLAVDIQFGYLRVFPFYIYGTVTPIRPVTRQVAQTLLNEVNEALALYFAPANRQVGVRPTLMEVIDVVENADSSGLIRHFDPGTINTTGIVWKACDVDFFNAISFAKYEDSSKYIRFNPQYIID